MARLHGSQAKVYFGGRDASGDLSDVTISGMADTHESTTFASNGAHEFDPGLIGWEAELSAFYDPSTTGIGRQLETLLGANGGILSVYEGLADAIGDRGVLLSDGILTKRSQPISVSDLIKLKGSLKPSAPTGGAKAGLYATLLHVLAARSTTANGTSHNNGASTTNGGRTNLHITAATGTGGIITIEDSANNSTWLTIATFATAAAAGAQTIELSGTIRQYTRAVWTINVTSSLTFVAGIARY